MNQDFNIGEIIVAVADRYADRVAFKLTDGSVSYDQFRDMIFSHASRMRVLGINREACVAIDVAHPASQLCIALACALLGCRWVRGSIEALASKAVGVTHHIYSGKVRLPGAYLSCPVDQTWLPNGRFSERYQFEGFASSSAIWMIVQSSGTTGTPKFMAISAGAVPLRVEARPYDYLAGNMPVVTSLIHHLFTFGLEYALKALVLGGTIVVARDLAYLANNGVTTVVGSPVQLLQLCERSGSSGSKIKCAVLGGARCTEELLDHIFEHFELVQNQLGCSELGIMTVNCFSVDATNRLSVGRPVPSCAIEIVDDEDKPLLVGEEGILRARSVAHVSPYLGGEAPDMVRDGWFYSGDMGVLSNSGDLTVTGRTNDVINFGGTKLNAAAMDDVILGTAGVKDGACFVQSEFSAVNQLGLLLVPEIDEDAEATISRVQDALFEKFGNRGQAHRIYVANALPRNENGKVSREFLAKSLSKAQPFAVRMTEA